jgi:glycerophosphoryl diester phosphodiesterase
MAAFRAALEAGADGLELDVHLSRDGYVVVMHDEAVDRTTNGHGLLAKMSLRNLQALDAGRWFALRFSGEPVPTLDEVLAEFAGQIQLNLEVKETAAGLTVLDLVSGYPAVEVVLSSFERPLLRALRRADPEVPLAVLTEDNDWHRALALAEDLRAVAFHPRVDKITRPMLQRCCELGLPVHAWTVDDPRQARRLFRTGVNGVFTNDPVKIRSALFAE